MTYLAQRVCATAARLIMFQVQKKSECVVCFWKKMYLCRRYIYPMVSAVQPSSLGFARFARGAMRHCMEIVDVTTDL